MGAEFPIEIDIADMKCFHLYSPHMKQRVGIGQDSHRFLTEYTKKQCIVGGLLFEGVPGFDADSDGDVVFHAICNAISSVTHVPILGGIAVELCQNQGITDSRIFLERALATLNDLQIDHIALSLEGKRPRFQEHSERLRQSVAQAVGIEKEAVGITFTSGDELTSFGLGKGVMCICCLTLSS